MTNPDLAALKRDYSAGLARARRLPPRERWQAWSSLLSETVQFNAFEPINNLTGRERVWSQFVAPLLAAFPDLERHNDCLLSGVWKSGAWTASFGHLTGAFEAPWLGVAPTGGAIALRFGEYCRWEHGSIAEVYCIIDVLDWLRQSGQYPAHIAPGRGLLDRWPAPACPPRADDTEAATSLKLVEAMIVGLMSYDGATLESMGMERFWHPEMMWYGPGGIGTSRRLKGFQDVHQRAFLHAFPDRIGGDHKCRIGDGHFVASTGWPSVRATHKGAWLHAPATGQRIGMRVMDFWRREDALLHENWVLIDQLDLLKQMGVTVLKPLPPA